MDDFKVNKIFRSRLFSCLVLIFFTLNFLSNLVLGNGQVVKTDEKGLKNLLSVRRPNIILIIIDSLRPDHLSYFGYFRPTSPVIDQLCQGGVVFRKVIAQSSQTGPAIASLWTGLYPSRHGIQLYSYNQSYDPIKRDVPPFLDDAFRTMAEYLKENGYTTMAIVANPWLQPEFGFAQGFDQYFSILPNYGQLTINKFNETVANLRTSDEKPYFAYLHLMDTHAPYLNPSGPKNLFVKFRGEPIYGMGYKDEVRSQDLVYACGLYDEQIHYVDGLIGQLIDYLQKKGIFKETLLILASDHGEEFYEHLGLGHGVTLYNEVITTFFLLYLPELFGHKVIEDRVQAIDLLPTILDLLGISYEQELLDGESLIPLIFSSSSGFKMKKERIFLSELGDKKAVIYDKFKYIYDFFLQTEELYDLKRDPGELLNLADEKIETRKNFKNLLMSTLKLEKESFPLTTKLRKSILERLQTLGYVSAKEENASFSGEILTLPISNQIIFSRPTYNPLQLIYGWKQRLKNKNEIFCEIGPFVKFVLNRGDKLKRKNHELIIEGKIISDPVDDFTITLKIYSERRLLGCTRLETEKNFLVKIKLPRKFALERSVEFLLTWTIANKEENEDTKIPEVSFLISQIIWN
ncbi:MAG: sulfatase-like hydrolase/transferase [Candidatus Aminicenantes bacterium]|nr:sulfatase-like hydrolase/transferase [Candidatus Aminicenantes bacterium]